MDKIGRLLERCVNFLVTWTGNLTALMTFAMAVLIAYDAFARYLGHPTIWIGEISTYLLVWISFVGAAYGLERGAHFRVTILYSRWSEKRQKQVEIALFTLGLIFCILLFKGGLDVTLRSLKFGGRSMTPLRAPLIFPQAAIPIGTFLLSVQLLRMILQDALYLLRHGRIRQFASDD
jgi:TRAP-type C4-dicarboxylate transport system permease small subunit